MSIGKQGINQNRDSVSLWNVYMPSDIDRDKYIKKAYRSGQVTLINDNGEVQHRVKIGLLAIQLIKFPANLKSLGSQVICLSAPYSGKLHVVDIYNSSTEFNDQDENQYRLFKTSTGYAEVRIDGKGKISLTVDGEEDVSGDVSINITNKNKQGKLNLNVNGDIMVNNQGNTIVSNDGTIQVTSTGNIKATVSKDETESYVEINKDEINLVSQTNTSINIKKDEVKVVSEGKIYLNDSTEPILLGTKTVQLISDILDQLGKESAGPYPLLGNSFYISKKADLEQLKSTLSFVK